MTIDKNYKGIKRLENGDYVLNKIITDEDLIIDLDDRLIVEECIETKGSIKANFPIKAISWIQAGGNIETGKWIQAGGNIETGGWIKAGEWIQAGDYIQAERWIQAGGNIETGGSIKAGKGISAGLYIKSNSYIQAGLPIFCRNMHIERNRVRR